MSSSENEVEVIPNPQLSGVLNEDRGEFSTSESESEVTYRPKPNLSNEVLIQRVLQYLKVKQITNSPNITLLWYHLLEQFPDYAKLKHPQRSLVHISLKQAITEARRRLKSTDNIQVEEVTLDDSDEEIQEILVMEEIQVIDNPSQAEEAGPSEFVLELGVPGPSRAKKRKTSPELVDLSSSDEDVSSTKNKEICNQFMESLTAADSA